MRSFIIRLWKDESGPAAVEYALMIGLIALVIVGVVQLLGQSLSTKFEDMNSAFTT